MRQAIFRLAFRAAAPQILLFAAFLPTGAAADGLCRVKGTLVSPDPCFGDSDPAGVCITLITPVAGVIAVRPAARGAGREVKRIPSDGNGRFRTRLKPGRYYFDILEPGSFRGKPLAIHNGLVRIRATRLNRLELWVKVKD